MAGPGDHVLIRAVITDDGRCVVVAPGVELPIGAVKVMAELPPASAEMPVGLVLMFETPDDMQQFVDTWQAEDGDDAR